MPRDTGEVVGIDVFLVVGIGVGAETAAEDDGRRVGFHLAFAGVLVACAGIGVLCADVADEWVQAWMHVFDVIFAHDFFVDYGGVLFLLGEEGLEEV